MPIVAVAAIGAATGIAGGVMQSRAAGKAADAQSQAAMYAADLQHKDAEEALAFQKNQWDTQQKNAAPWLKAGTSAIDTLSSLMQPGGELTQPWTEQFKAPTNVTEQNDPGYKFRLAEGQKLLERSAAARGNLLSGGTAKGLQRFGQDYASNEYSNVYNRSWNEYAGRYNQFETNQANKFNRLSSLAGGGQTAVNQLGLLGDSASRNVRDILMTSGQQIGQDYQNAAAARASGYVGSANAWSGALSGIGNSFSNLFLLSQLNKGGGGSSYGPSDSGTAGYNYDPSYDPGNWA